MTHRSGRRYGQISAPNPLRMVEAGHKFNQNQCVSNQHYSRNVIDRCVDKFFDHPLKQPGVTEPLFNMNVIRTA